MSTALSNDTFNQATFQRLSETKFISSTGVNAHFDLAGTPLSVSAHAQNVIRLTLGRSTLPDYGLLREAPAATLEVTPTQTG